MEGRLTYLLGKVSDSYPGFSAGVLGFASDYDVVDEMILYLEEHPSADTSEILWYLIEVSGMSPIEDT